MSIKPRQFVSKSSIEDIVKDTEIGYVLGSHIRKGLYEPVNPEISGLMRGVYDDPDCKDVDPLCSYKLDKFEKSVLANTSPQTPTTPSVGQSSNTSE